MTTGKDHLVQLAMWGILVLAVVVVAVVGSFFRREVPPEEPLAVPPVEKLQPPSVPEDKPKVRLPEINVEKRLTALRGRLTEKFDRLLEAPEAYDRLVRKECELFPEGDIFPFVFPAIAYANLALREPELGALYREKAAKLILLAVPPVVRQVRPPEKDLSKLESYRGNATYLAHFNLALGCYRLAGGDERFDAVHRSVSESLFKSLEERKGKPLFSYPGETWTYDTIAALVSLKLYDRVRGTSRSDVVMQRHMAWVAEHATEETLALPMSRAGNTSELPRGCDLSLRVCLLAHVDRPAAEALYPNYTRAFWIEQWPLAGFAEWPCGKAKFEDIDSGPIILGMGMAATGLGIGTTIAMSDKERLSLLLRELAARDLLLPAYLVESGGETLLGGMIPFDRQYVTGFLFGDAMLFYSVTWTQWLK